MGKEKTKEDVFQKGAKCANKHETVSDNDASFSFHIGFGCLHVNRGISDSFENAFRSFSFENAKTV